MTWKLVTDSDLCHLNVPQRFFAYARAYRDAAAGLCDLMTKSPEHYTWPHGAVVLMLSAHSVELFLKGALWTQSSPDEIEHHRIENLAQKFKERFPGPDFEWEIPFKTEYAGLNETEVAALKKTAPVPSILYRFPVGKGGSEWRGAYGFEANSFVAVLEELRTTYARLESHLA